MAPLYELENVAKSFDNGQLEIFSGIDLCVESGESLAIVGASGSGKSTLLHIMGALDQPSAGRVLFQGQDLAAMDAAAKAHFRNKSIGFVFQFHHLLPEFSAVENVALPGIISGQNMSAIMPRAIELMERTGLGKRLYSRPAVLSGGERQRTAIARALIMQPLAILADEPTGNLDGRSGVQVEQLLLELNRDLGMAMIVVTHNRDLARSMDRVLELKGGKLYETA